jgi:hypothetical protein
MGFSQEQVTSLLQQHGVQFQTFQHAPVMTVEAQVLPSTSRVPGSRLPANYCSASSTAAVVDVLLAL